MKGVERMGVREAVGSTLAIFCFDLQRWRGRDCNIAMVQHLEGAIACCRMESISFEPSIDRRKCSSSRLDFASRRRTTDLIPHGVAAASSSSFCHGAVGVCMHCRVFASSLAL